jgi:hypothetical protein
MGMVLTPEGTGVGRIVTAGQTFSTTDWTAAIFTGFFEPTAIFIDSFISLQRS